MAQLDWMEEYSVGVEEFDFHHKRVFVLLKDLRNTDPADTEKIRALLTEFIGHAVYHFAAEEKYFDKFHYPDTKKHKKEHELYKAKMDRFMDEEIDYEKVLSFIEKWWKGHILKEDKKYKKFFNDRGVY